MINYIKGPAYGLTQSDYSVPLPSGNTAGTFVAGMGGYVSTTGVATLGAPSTTTLNLLYGFFMLNDTDSSVIATNKITMLMLDGSSVIATDQCANAINASNYPIGASVSINTAGAVITSTGYTTAPLFGVVYDNARTLPALVNITAANGTVIPVQTFTAVLLIKLGTGVK